MGITFLMALLLSAVAFTISYRNEKKYEKQDKETKWLATLFFCILGSFVGLLVSILIGEKISNNYLASESVVVFGTLDLQPFSNSNDVYIVTGENNNGKKVIWYLQGEELFEEPYNAKIDRNMIIFTSTTAPVKQLVKVDVGSFWELFAFIPESNRYRFVIPYGGLQEGKILKTYKFIPVQE